MSLHRALLGAGLLVVVAGCSSTPPRTALPSSPTTAVVAPPPEPSPSPSPTGDPTAELTVEEKVGQLLMPVLYGSSARAAHQENLARYGVGSPAEVIQKYHLGGVILFPGTGNIESARQVATFTAGLRAAARKVPLLIGVDQENGIVSRLKGIVTEIPGASVIGQTGDLRNARDAARVTAEELNALGISLDFAPVADVNVNPNNPVIGPRAYGNDPEEVADMVGAAVQGFRDGGVAATVKHFPGHGDTNVDSHTSLPVIDHTREEWEKLDAPPFKEAIANDVDAVMSAHIVMPALDPSGDPATLSKKILTGVLRGELGFDGVVFTDALNMDGVRKKYGDGEVAVRAILAGADILLMPPDFDAARDAVLAAVESGRISATRLNQSVGRILHLKREFRLDSPRTFPTPAEAVKLMKTSEHRAVARRISSATK
ncbi:beta-N-acetylhexosaminidase [Herbidospora yilanensis]|uniref:beta-N-acetylhexosaminidase n=1 Tax=Herbidospora yilanensis TaxID=354426 RepID=UPI000AD8350E|nr:beta-N-acetylhexosaminidase [Herbidospora yilanensis]